MSSMESPGGAPDAVSGIPVIAAADNGWRSRIPINATYVQVPSYTTNTDDWIILPTGVPPGHTIRGWSEVAHEMRTEPGSNIEINSEDCDGTKEAAIPATTLWEVTFVNSTIGWILRAWDELAAPITAIVPD